LGDPLELGLSLARPLGRDQDGQGYGHVLAGAGLMPDKWALDRQLGDHAFGKGLGKCASGFSSGELDTTPLQVLPTGAHRGLDRLRRGRLSPEERQRELALAGNARESRVERGGALLQRRARVIGVREGSTEPDRKTRLSRADRLYEAVMLEGIGALELDVGSPLGAPETEIACLGPGQRPAAKTILREHRWG